MALVLQEAESASLLQSSGDKISVLPSRKDVDSSSFPQKINRKIEHTSLQPEPVAENSDLSRDIANSVQENNTAMEGDFARVFAQTLRPILPDISTCNTRAQRDMASKESAHLVCFQTFKNRACNYGSMRWAALLWRDLMAVIETPRLSVRTRIKICTLLPRPLASLPETKKQSFPITLPTQRHHHSYPLHSPSCCDSNIGTEREAQELEKDLEEKSCVSKMIPVIERIHQQIVVLLSAMLFAVTSCFNRLLSRIILPFRSHRELPSALSPDTVIGAMVSTLQPPEEPNLFVIAKDTCDDEGYISGENSTDYAKDTKPEDLSFPTSAARVEFRPSLLSVTDRMDSPSKMTLQDVRLENSTVITSGGNSDIYAELYRAQKVCMEVLRLHAVDDGVSQSFRQEALHNLIIREFFRL